MLEAANYYASPRLVPSSYCKATYSVEEGASIEQLAPSSLPSDWDSMPYPSSTQLIGDEFLTRCDALFLLVPSVAVGSTEEVKIAVANPHHPEIHKIKLLKKEKPDCS